MLEHLQKRQAEALQRYWKTFLWQHKEKLQKKRNQGLRPLETQRSTSALSLNFRFTPMQTHKQVFTVPAGSANIFTRLLRLMCENCASNLLCTDRLMVRLNFSRQYTVEPRQKRYAEAVQRTEKRLTPLEILFVFC